ncbi:MAG: hypothetical protein K6A68_10050 [Clostridiales bacterium]|nr:hypothetical protein [Clostridiales bacterium]
MTKEEKQTEQMAGEDRKGSTPARIHREEYGLEQYIGYVKGTRFCLYPGRERHKQDHVFLHPPAERLQLHDAVHQNLHIDHNMSQMIEKESGHREVFLQPDASLCGGTKALFVSSGCFLPLAFHRGLDQVKEQ